MKKNKNELFGIEITNNVEENVEIVKETKEVKANKNLKISDTLTFENADDVTIKKFIKQFIEEETQNDNMTLIINEYIESTLQGLNYSEEKLKELLFAHRYSKNLKRMKIETNKVYMNNGESYNNDILNTGFKNFSEGYNSKKDDIKFCEFGFPCEAYIPNISLNKKKDWFELTIYKNRRSLESIKNKEFILEILNIDLNDKFIEDMFSFSFSNFLNNYLFTILNCISPKIFTVYFKF